MTRTTIKRIILLAVMFIIAILTFPGEVFTFSFWGWLTLILGATIILALVVLGEEQLELFDMINLENFKKAPIFGVLAIPFIISLIATMVCIIK